MNIIFDFDGTLHNTAKIYNIAVNKAYSWLVEIGLAQPKSFGEEETAKYLGMTRQDMWASFMPELKEPELTLAGDMVGEELLKSIEAGYAELYDGIVEVLHTLKQNGHNLIILSNCRTAYMQAQIKRFDLDKWFSDYYCSSSYPGKEKYEIFLQIATKYKGDFCVIGDRGSDIEVGSVNGIKSIGCLYGYGNKDELSKATELVSCPEEILEKL